jgi:phosphonate transport system permease protein
LSARNAIFVDDIGSVLARHRATLTKSPLRRAAEIGGPIAVLALTGFAIRWLGISFAQIGPGLVELGKFLALMVPPSTGGHLQLYLCAMGETLTIAFLGTLTAAIVAAPLGLLAAKNTTPSAVLRFAIRRCSIRSAASTR